MMRRSLAPETGEADGVIGDLETMRTRINGPTTAARPGCIIQRAKAAPNQKITSARPSQRLSVGVTTFSRRAMTPSKMSDNTASDSKIAAAPPA